MEPLLTYAPTGTPTVLTQHDYQYSGVGLRSQGTDKVGAFSQPATAETFAYDALDNRTQRTARPETLVSAALQFRRRPL